LLVGSGIIPTGSSARSSRKASRSSLPVATTTASAEATLNGRSRLLLSGLLLLNLLVAFRLGIAV
jgi:hypothetical protein